MSDIANITVRGFAYHCFIHDINRYHNDKFITMFNLGYDELKGKIEDYEGKNT